MLVCATIVAQDSATRAQENVTILPSMMDEASMDEASMYEASMDVASMDVAPAHQRAQHTRGLQVKAR